MQRSPLSAHTASPLELQAQLEADRCGDPYLVYRDGENHQQIRSLGEDRDHVTVGRGESTDTCLSWDTGVSHLHATLERLGDDWVVVDDGLSSNGSFVNGERLHGRRRLRDRDELRFGATVVAFRAPAQPHQPGTVQSLDPQERVGISQAQRRVLVALCRPFKDASPFTAPASNQQIAAELVLSVDAVKTHVRALMKKFAVEDLPPNQKRLKLVELALASGLVSQHEL